MQHACKAQLVLTRFHTQAQLQKGEVLRVLQQSPISRRMRYTCSGLFEVHKLLFSFQMCANSTWMSPAFSLQGGLVVEESTCRTPLIFVLSPGVDPTGALLQLAEASGMSKHFHALSLGQGQAPIAKRMTEEGVKNDG
ncbi:dynein axonemal heavy chain 3-like isoform X1 [Siniperca chuatsi]|uniref:dynein axonemal heavy chain 3-like isoform X1 n=1 Tax=Siniperca chuatsi TaxID=119488 RepID=UPI001CE10DC2|nr:dynein axonemal heavy chain 3-like isoform X1 [Siniperca chuatsi]